MPSFVEDKFIRRGQARRADSTRVLARAVLGAFVRIGARVETKFVLIAQRSPGGRIDFKGQTTGKERQQTKRDIDHGFRSATLMPESPGPSLECGLGLRSSVAWENPPPQLALPAGIASANKPRSELLPWGAVHFP